ncbi:OprO/OprP family phosphate-selective porin [Tamlana sp. 62-3]|uniref:OprO/OprP family phosphate-selective porin n=1 Tax=Neotamlana sargassicola TaxID=2883125 RepID=A0A9X1L5A5_9FLAO|nr:OprO/OprP family phosphate-selective porin [Tamlana sargassicola]MCB4809047.1 OprO/OprP family phosphate-selective porin [Tamlana sargassicola]
MITKFKTSITLLVVLLSFSLFAQNRQLDNYRQPDKNGVNVFEAPKDSDSTFDGVKVRVGGSSTLQFQAIDQENSGDTELAEIGYNFNLATANLDLDVALYDGVRMHLRTYLSSRHHTEPYVKGGYFQIDKLDFISEGFLEGFMKNATIKIGHMETNYGDAHFRRTDNAQAIFNPFVGNLIMDAFTTEVGAELYYNTNKGLFAMVGFTNGKLNQSVKASDGDTGGASFVAKLGYDKQLNEDLRFRLTGSVYNTGYVPNSYLYAADRGGSRYYSVLQDADATSDNFRSGRYNPAFGNKISAIMINPFVKYKGLEFFGTFETSSGNAIGSEERTATQLAGELIYRFGKNENLFVGARYNTVNADDTSGEDITINRTQLGAGWFMTKNILIKAEYVNQTYDGFTAGSLYDDAKFSGLMLEAVISF